MADNEAQAQIKYYFHRMMDYAVLVGGIKGLISAAGFAPAETVLNEIEKLLEKFDDVSTL